MTTIKELTVSKSDLVRVKPENINVKAGWNVREMTADYLAYIDTLAQSIAEIGVREALKCYMENGKLYVSNGHSRLLACERAKTVYGAEVVSVPVVMEDRYSSEADKTLSMLTSNSGRALTPLEVAAVYKRLYALGMTEQEIARKSGVSLSSVNRSLEISAMPEAAKELVREGKVSASLALEAVKAGELDELKDAAEQTEGKVTRQKLDGVERAKRGSKASVKAIIEAAFDTVEYNEDATTVTMTLTSDQWREMLRLLKL